MKPKKSLETIIVDSLKPIFNVNSTKELINLLNEKDTFLERKNLINNIHQTFNSNEISKQKQCSYMHNLLNKGLIDDCNAGDIYHVLNDFDKAIKYYQKFLEKTKHPEDIRYLSNISDIIDPKVLQSYRYLGIIFYDMEKYSEAEKYFEKGSKLGDIACTFGLGNTYRMQNKLDDAIIQFTSAAYRGILDAYINLGLIYEEQGDYDNANYQYKLALNRGYSEAEEYLDKLNRKMGKN